MQVCRTFRILRRARSLARKCLHTGACAWLAPSVRRARLYYATLSAGCAMVKCAHRNLAIRIQHATTQTCETTTPGRFCKRCMPAAAKHQLAEFAQNQQRERKESAPPPQHRRVSHRTRLLFGQNTSHRTQGAANGGAMIVLHGLANDRHTKSGTHIAHTNSVHSRTHQARTRAHTHARAPSVCAHARARANDRRRRCVRAHTNTRLGKWHDDLDPHNWHTLPCRGRVRAISHMCVCVYVCAVYECARSTRSAAYAACTPCNGGTKLDCMCVVGRRNSGVITHNGIAVQCYSSNSSSVSSAFNYVRVFFVLFVVRSMNRMPLHQMRKSGCLCVRSNYALAIIITCLVFQRMFIYVHIR